MKRTFQLLLFCIVVSSAAIAQKTNNVEIVELNAKSFKEKVWNFDKEKSFKRVGNLPIILDFHATWCGPCKLLAPHLQAIQNKYKGKLIVYKIDVDKDPEIAQRFNVQAMPTMVFMATKEKYKSELGYGGDYNELEKLVKTNLSLN
jgi:thioredoxin 1